MTEGWPSGRVAPWLRDLHLGCRLGEQVAMLYDYCWAGCRA